MGENGAHGFGVLHGGDDPQASATARARQDVEIEDAPHQGRPRQGAGWARGGIAARAWLGRRPLRPGGCRAAIADNVPAPAGMRGQHAVIDQQIDRRAGRDGRELLQQLHGVEQQVGGAVPPGGLELEEDAAVGAQAQPVLGQRRAQQIAAQVFEAGAIVRGNPDIGVEIEAIELGLARPARGGVAHSGLGPEATHARAGARAEGDAALDGGADEPGQDGGGLGERVGRDAVVVGLETAAGEEARPTRARTVARTCATSSSVGGGAG